MTKKTPGISTEGDASQLKWKCDHFFVSSSWINCVPFFAEVVNQKKSLNFCGVGDVKSAFAAQLVNKVLTFWCYERLN